MESVGFFIHMVRLCGVVLVQLGYSLLRLVAVCARVRFHLNLLEEKSMKMKLNALSLAVAAGFIGSAAQAADVAMFPYVVNSPTVTTLVTVVDRGDNTTQRYTSGGAVANVAAGGNRLHWRLNYKADANATVNTASCSEVDYYLPTSSNDIQTVDLGGKFGSTTKGVLFSDPSVNNNWNAGTSAALNYMMGKAAGVTQRGVLFVHNSDNVAGTTIYGEAMVLEVAGGASWGYQAVTTDNAAANDNLGFQFAGAGNLVSNSLTASVAGPAGILTFMPPAEVTTNLYVTPVPAAAPLLAANGASVAGWDQQQTAVSLNTAPGGVGAGVAFDRDETLVSGAVAQQVRCVGAVSVPQLVTSGALTVLANGGWGNVTLAAGAAGTATTAAYVTKLEYATGTLNGEAMGKTINNGFIMR